jgi:hypothetical protein
MGIASNKKPNWQRILLIPCIFALIVSLYPTTSIVCPAWTLQVVDESGNPLRGAFVRQVWQDYTLESSSHEQDAQTDGNGYVSFPERTVKASLLSRMFGTIIKGISLNVHASHGPSAYILAYGEIVEGKRLEGSAHYREGVSLPQQLMTYVYDLHLK